MAELKGYVGRVLRVDLSKSKIVDEPLRKEIAIQYLGGYGIGARILYDEVSPNVQAFDPENRLIFSTGPLTGTIVPTAARFMVVAKSPATGYLGDANAGGFFGPELKFSGYDIILFNGKASRPTYLLVHEGASEIRDASHLWGKDSYETEDTIKKEVGDPRVKVSCIGPAGENHVLIAGIVNEKGRIAARCGLGAVMGSKNLKAVAVRGTRKVEVAFPDKLPELAREAQQLINKHEGMKWQGKHGTSGWFDILMEIGDTPVRHWTKGKFPANKLTGERMSKTILKTRKACFSCPIGCRRHVTITEAPYTMDGEGPEYETSASLGSLCGITDQKAVAKANDLCNRYGLDTISYGSVVAFAMECYEKKKITESDTDGLQFRFGNAEVVIGMVEKVAKRQGFGKVLADGEKRASEKIGKGAQELAMHVKGLEIPMHDPRAFYGCGLGYAVGATGARHTEFLLAETQNPKTRYHINSRARIIVNDQNLLTAASSLGLCLFPLLVEGFAKFLPRFHRAVTGLRMTMPNLMKIGERIFNLKRAFNIRQGMGVEEDSLPKRFLAEPLREGGAKGHVVPLRQMLIDYYKLRGWDKETGVATERTLERLCLSDLARDLYTKRVKLKS